MTQIKHVFFFSSLNGTDTWGRRKKKKALVMVMPVTRLSHVSTIPQRGLIIQSKDVHFVSI